MLIIHLIRLAEGVIHHLLDISQKAAQHSQGAIQGCFKFILIIYKGPCNYICYIPVQLSPDLGCTHSRIGKNPYYVGRYLLPVLSSKYREDIGRRLCKIPLHLHNF
ncbi:hypothetical protein IMSAG025_00729 [Muribaculaceae bacterium]|nr:hypothetical protein IMSAG025_00729 [Muribaculaceae bacterium]